MIVGGAGADRLNGGDGDDTYEFTDGFGVDRFSDTTGNVALDFSGMSAALIGTINGRGVEFYDANGNKLRISRAAVNEIHLGTNDDTVHVTDFPERTIGLYDSAGDDSYCLRMGRAQSSKAVGTLNITDTSGTFDEITLEQTSAVSPIALGSFQAVNGREVVNYNTDVERLTLMGKAGQYDHADIIDFGGRVSYTHLDEDDVSDLKSTGIRILADEITMNSELKASYVILETFDDLNITQRLNAGSNGYIDARVFDDDAAIHIAADVLVSAEDDWSGTGSGWVRMISAAGSIINDNASTIKATGGHLISRRRTPSAPSPPQFLPRSHH